MPEMIGKLSFAKFVKQLAIELRGHALWDVIKYLIFVIFGPTVIASFYALWRELRHLSVDWRILGGLFAVSLPAFVAFISALLYFANKTSATLHQDREEIYDVVVETIRQVRMSQRGQKPLLLVALHGESGPKRTSPLTSYPSLTSFDVELRDCVNSSGPDRWYVRELYNIADEGRLRMVLDRIRQAPTAEYYEVRAYCIPDPIAQFQPLVIGSEDLFLAVDDPTYYRVSAGMHIRGNGFVLLATQHFEQLWNAQHPRLFRLRDATGENTSEIQLLSAAIAQLHAKRE
jgi:hypothetical protein